MIAPSGAGTASVEAGPSTDAPVAAAGGPPADSSAVTSNNFTVPKDTTSAPSNSGDRASDCDFIDIDGNNNVVSVNISNNTTATDSVHVQYRCGTGNATSLDHDFIDVNGNNNSVTVVVWAKNGTISFGDESSGTEKSGLHVALQCEGNTLADCDAVDIDGHNNSVTLIVIGDEGKTIHNFGVNSSEI